MPQAKIEKRAVHKYMRLKLLRFLHMRMRMHHNFVAIFCSAVTIVCARRSNNLQGEI
jgi:hypothetical protein